ncbi:response regulator [Clostridium hydrogeniformans]|uniref:response regulator n=1 Tax=Clostridium hydrogeniformans TaxID=349933 RepID=UPI000690CA6A|nr:response regulator [Clostridium hydrogeniformans]
MKNKVLIVDDVKNIREMLRTCLQDEGYEVFEATCAREAMECIEKENIKIVFSDIKMPEVNGTELLKSIKNHNRNIIVIIMTAFGTIKNAVQCTKYGASAYLQKPFTAKRVKGILDEVLGKEQAKTDINFYITSAKKLLDKGDINKAHEILKRALIIKDDCGEIYSLIGDIEEISGEHEKAENFRSFAKALGFHKDDNVSKS